MSSTSGKSKLPARRTETHKSEFLAYYGAGARKKNISQARFMSRAAEYAVNDLKLSGKFRRTVGGQLFYTMENPTPFIAPLIEGDIRLQALINSKFGVNPASANLYMHLIRAMQMEANSKGEKIDRRLNARLSSDPRRGRGASSGAGLGSMCSQ